MNILLENFQFRLKSSTIKSSFQAKEMLSWYKWRI